MKTLVVMLAGAALSGALFAQGKRVDPATDSRHWKRTFADEFTGMRLDRAKWIDSYPNGERTHSNNEQQYYTSRPENA